MRRGRVPIVDMRRSGISKADWKAVEMDEGKLPDNWKKKVQYVPVKYKGVGSAIRPPWKFFWNINTEQAIRDDKYMYEYTPVTVDDGYWPEHVPPDEKGNFTRGDLILAKVPLQAWIDRTKDELRRAGIEGRLRLNSFRTNVDT